MFSFLFTDNVKSDHLYLVRQTNDPIIRASASDCHLFVTDVSIPVKENLNSNHKKYFFLEIEDLNLLDRIFCVLESFVVGPRFGGRNAALPSMRRRRAL